MQTYIKHIETVNPPTSYRQDLIRDRMKHFIADDRMTQAIIHKIYNESGIAKRHSVIKDFDPDAREFVLFHPDEGVLQPGTGERNTLYVQHATPFFVQLARNVIDRAGLQPEDITHVITVSCTGFYAPGPDFEIVESLGLSPRTQRYHLGFMGCYAAFPALRMAQSFCAAHPDAQVLIVSVELCTLHFQASKETDHLIGAAVFADGGAGFLVSNQPASNEPCLKINAFANTVTETGKKDMAWTIGDRGFEMILSTYVPEIIEANIGHVLKPLFDDAGVTAEDINFWGLHPGGRSIVDKVQKQMQLCDSQVAASRKILAEYGNMSSATVLFVLKALLECSEVAPGDLLLGLAFGPGLTIESGLFEKTV